MVAIERDNKIDIKIFRVDTDKKQIDFLLD